MTDTIMNFFDTQLVAPFVISLIFSIVLGPIFIPVLHKLKFGQPIRGEGPKSHQKKAGTPTMGGLIFFISVAATLLITAGFFKSEDTYSSMFTSPRMIILYSFVAFGVVGFLDDILKIIHKENEGLKPGQKMILLIVFSVLIAVYGYYKIGSDILIPFTGGYKWNIGWLYIPFIIIYFSATTNAVNLTDGLDGLATSVTIIVLTFFTIVGYKMGTPVGKDAAIFSIALIGALLGFLRYNAFPAKIFMGDTGSLALGGAVGTIALMLKMELWVIIVGMVYLMETLSVILQVASFKMTGKRIFKMAPIHHHFEQCGWSEVKIVAVFSLAATVMCIIGFIAI